MKEDHRRSCGVRVPKGVTDKKKSEDTEERPESEVRSWGRKETHVTGSPIGGGRGRYTVTKDVISKRLGRRRKNCISGSTDYPFSLKCPSFVKD